MRQILIIESDSNIAALISIYVHPLACQIRHCTDAETGLAAAAEEFFDVIIIASKLPDMSGLDVCSILRKRENSAAIFILTRPNEVIDIVEGLETGADEFIKQPLDMREFVARIKAALRRQALHEKSFENGQPSVLRIEKLMIERDKRRVALDGIRIDLTPKEYELLVLLASNPGKSYSREDLLNKIWGAGFEGHEHTINTHINRLRAKIEYDFSRPRYVLTSWGIGYRFSDELHIEKVVVPIEINEEVGLDTPLEQDN